MEKKRNIRRGNRMKSIKFHHNWNKKLDCDVFTTIRRHTPPKEIYYRYNEGQIFDVIVDGKSYCQARLYDVQKEVLASLDDRLLFCDTGSLKPYEVFESFGLKPTSKVLVLTFIREGTEVS